jgi:hypothetical protein
MKQTTVEWLVKQLPQIQQEGLRDIWEQAKAMEKEQIEDAHIEGQRVFDNYEHTQWTTDQAEQYYNETYHSVESNEMIDHIGDANKMIEDDVEKLAKEEYPIFDGGLLSIAYNQKHSRIDFIKGYNKAKETLYTEEQVRKAIELARGIKDDEITFDISSIIGCGELCTYGWKEEYSNEEIIQSLKQPKKD